MADTLRIRIGSLARNLRELGDKLRSPILQRRFAFALLVALIVSKQVDAQTPLPSHIWITTSSTSTTGPPTSSAEVASTDVANGSSVNLNIWGQPPVGKRLTSFSFNIVCGDSSVASFVTSSAVVHNANTSGLNRFEYVVDSTPQALTPVSIEQTSSSTARFLDLKGFTVFGSNPGVGGANCGSNPNCVSTDSGPAWLLASLSVKAIAGAGTAEFFLQLGDIGINQSNYSLPISPYNTDSTAATTVILGAANDPAYTVSNAIGSILEDSLYKLAGDTPDFVLRAGGSPPSGDFNSDGKVDAADYVTWRNGLGSTYNQSQYTVWRSQFGQTFGNGTNNQGIAVPEPPAVILLIFCSVVLLAHSRRAIFCRPCFLPDEHPSSTTCASRSATGSCERRAFVACRKFVLALAAFAIVACVPKCASAISMLAD